MSKRLLQLIPILAGILFFSANLLAQTDTFDEAKILKQPQPSYPAEAKKTGIGGNISVKVSIDDKGKVVSIDDVNGPDWVCRSVTRVDVVALRKAAAESAQKATFTPALRNGTPIASSATLVYFIGKTRIIQEMNGPATVIVMRAGPPNAPTIGQANDQIPPIPTPTGPTPSPETLAGGVLNGSAVELATPKYPAAAKAVRASGSVKVQVLIETDGQVFSAEPVSGHPLLRSASQIAACSSRFTPTLLSGNPVRVSGYITYNFNL